jgi:hypothetical protein
MSDVRDRLQKLERLLEKELGCRECANYVCVVRPADAGAPPWSAGTAYATCETCGGQRVVMVIKSSLPGPPGSGVRARTPVSDRVEAEPTGGVDAAPN